MKKNILYISPGFNLACGVSRHVYTLLKSEELKKEFNLFFITNGGDALAKLDKDGIKYFLMDFKSGKMLFFRMFRDMKWLKAFCAEKEIDIIHSHHRYPGYLSDRIKKEAGVRTVITAHNFVKGLKSISYRSDKIIAVSNAVNFHLQNHFSIPAEKTEVIYNCVGRDEGEYENKLLVRKSLNIPVECRIILYAGRIIKEKGIGVLLKAFNDLNRKYNSLQLIVIGSIGVSRKILAKMISGKKILLLQAQENITKFYRVADVVVLPSFKEPLGYIMLEAGVEKIPFVGSRAGGIAEFIEDGVNGFLFEPGNAIDLSNKISYVLTHPDEAALAAERLQEKVLKECNCADYFRKLIEIYDHLLQS